MKVRSVKCEVRVGGLRLRKCPYGESVIVSTRWSNFPEKLSSVAAMRCSGHASHVGHKKVNFGWVKRVSAWLSTFGPRLSTLPGGAA